MKSDWGRRGSKGRRAAASWRRCVLPAGLLALTALLWPAQPDAQNIRFFRIGTGDISGTLFSVGSAIAGALSNPPGSRACRLGGSCGVPNMVAVAQSTGGAIDNVRAISDGLLESGLVHADVAYWAFNGTGPFIDEEPMGDLRAVANLYPAVVHIATSQEGGIYSVSDLAGKRVALGPHGSGTPLNALAILAAYGLGEEDIAVVYLNSGLASDHLEAGEIDAFFVVGGIPVEALEDLAWRMQVLLLPVVGAARDEITSFYPFLADAEIKAGTYDRVPYVPTVSVGTQFIVSAAADEQLIYEVTKALWHERTRTLLDSGHPQAREIALEHALDQIAIPLHPGARRFYREEGLLP